MKHIKGFNEAYNENVQFSQLIGEVVDHIYVSMDKTSLYIITENGVIHNYYTDKDCCNTVWFNHINGVEFLINQRVNGVESRDWRDVLDIVGDDSEEEACSWVLRTKRGYIDIEVRNNHNGYYGGEVLHSIISQLPSDATEIDDDF